MTVLVIHSGGGKRLVRVFEMAKRCGAAFDDHKLAITPVRRWQRFLVKDQQYDNNP